MVGWFHGSGQDAVGLEADEFGADEECCGDYYDDYQYRCYAVVDFPACGLLPSAQVASFFRFVISQG